MTLQFRATLIENNPNSERPKTTHWSDKGHAQAWAKATVAASPDPEAFVSITELIEQNVEIVKKPEPPR